MARRGCMRTRVRSILVVLAMLQLLPGSSSKQLSVCDLVSQIWQTSCALAASNEVWVDDDYNAATAGFGNDHFDSIQNGINAVSQGGTVNVAAGTYPGTLNLQGKAFILSGAGIAETIIDASSLTGYAISNFGDGTVVKDLTLIGSTSYGFKVSHVSNVTLKNIKVENSGRTGIDLNTIDSAVLQNLEVTDTVSGFGIMILDSQNITVSDIATSGNAWGGVSVQTKNAVSENIAFSGIFNAQEKSPLLLEKDPSSDLPTDPPTYFDISITGIPGKFEHTVYAFREGNNYQQWFYQETLEDAKTLARALLSDPFMYSGMTVSKVAAANSYFVIEGMLIQDAIDAVNAGGTVNVDAGLYSEHMLVNKRISIIGEGSDQNGTVITQNATGAGDSKIGVFQIEASGLPDAPILFQNIRIQPDGMAGFSVGRFTETSGTNVSHVSIDNVKVKGTRPSACGEQERGLYVDPTSSLTHLVIINSAFDELVYGWYLHKDVSADTSNVRYVTVSDTTFTSNTHKGIYAKKLSDAVFTDCVFDANGYAADAFDPCTFFQPWQAGADINLKAGSYANIIFNNCQVTNNAHGEAKEGVGLTVKARGTGNDASYAAFPAFVDGITINDGTFTGNERGIRFGEPGKNNTGPTNVVVQYAAISGNDQTYTGSDGSAYGGLINAATTQILATANWWGANNGPDDSAEADFIQGNGDEIAGLVDADPWIRFVLKAENDQIILGSVPESSVRARLILSDSGETPADIHILSQFASVLFETDTGVLGILVINKDLVAGIAEAKFTSPTSTGFADISARALDASEQAISGAMDSTRITFTTGPLDQIVISPNEATVTAGSFQTYTAEAFDAYDNRLGDVTADTAFVIEAGAGGFWDKNIYTADLVGQWTVTGTYSGVNQTATLTVPFDSDGDGLSDSWEVDHFGDLSHDGRGDTDADGFTDLEEFLAGTDPTDVAERPIALPVVAGIFPITAANTDVTEITITGNRLSGTLSVSLESGDTNIEMQTFTVASATEIRITVPAGIAEGIYDIRVINTDGRNRFIEDRPALSIYAPVDLRQYSQSDINSAIADSGLNADSTAEEIIENLDPELVTAFDLEAMETDAGEAVEINESGELSLTLTSGVAIDGSVPVALTLATAPAAETDVAIDAVLKAGTSFTITDQNGAEQPYSGSIDPPSTVSITDTIEDQIEELGSNADDAVVFTMGNPYERLETSEPVFVNLEVTFSEGEDPPVIYFLEADGNLTLAGVDGTTEAGIAIQHGGTVLGSTRNEADGTITYSLGLLLDHMSTFVVIPASASSVSIGGDVNCFIASAVAGNAYASRLERQRNFKDAYHLINRLGDAFVKSHYRHTPFKAELIIDEFH